MRPLELVRKIVETGALLKKRQADLPGLSALDAGMRAVETTTTMARRLRQGPLPEARGLERVALTMAAGQLRAMAGLLGLERVVTAEPAPPPTAPETAQVPAEPAAGSLPLRVSGFVSPSDRALVRDEKEARLKAALAELVAETLALVDAVLASSPELGGGASRELPSGAARRPDRP